MYHVWGPTGTYIEGNNELALALVILLPLMYYLAQTSTKRWVRYGLWASMGACTFSILGSQSRGALVALGALVLLLGTKSQRPVIVTAVLVIVMAGAVAFMPDSWTSRMSTIETYDQDASAMSRIKTWKTIWNLALDRPIVGAGFDLDNPLIFQLYRRGPHHDQSLRAAQHLFPGTRRARFCRPCTVLRVGHRHLASLQKTRVGGPPRPASNGYRC